MWVKLTTGAVRIAVQDAAVCLLAYLAGFYFNQAIVSSSSHIGALWCVISGIVVLQATRRDTVASAWLRVLGTLIGAVISAIYLLFLPFNPIGLAVTIGITMLVCYILQIPDHARLAAITVAVIMVVSLVHPLMNAALRFIESCIGTVLAVLAVLAWPEASESH